MGADGPPLSCAGVFLLSPACAAGTPTRTGRLWPERSPRADDPCPSYPCWSRDGSGNLCEDQNINSFYISLTPVSATMPAA